jgi:predicted nucleic acid-binding Zn ribbon protein
MRRRAPRPAASAAAAIAGRLEPPTALAGVQRVWGDVVGPAIAQEATPVAEREGVLTVACRASVWAQELDLMGPQLLAGLNAALGADALRAIRCVTRPADRER